MVFCPNARDGASARNAISIPTAIAVLVFLCMEITDAYRVTVAVPVSEITTLVDDTTKKLTVQLPCGSPERFRSATAVPPAATLVSEAVGKEVTPPAHVAVASTKTVCAVGKLLL